MLLQDYTAYIFSSVGTVLVFITLVGYLSNTLNWKYLNFSLTHKLYYIGALVHETSHALVCILTGGKITEYKIFAAQPRVGYTEGKIPWLSNALVSFAPVVGGLGFLYLVNRFALSGYFTFPEVHSWAEVGQGVGSIFMQLDLLKWQAWVMLLLFLNAGAMIGPSARDLRNIWPILLLLLLVHSDVLMGIALLAATLILVNIAIQVVAILLLGARKIAAGKGKTAST